MRFPFLFLSLLAFSPAIFAQGSYDPHALFAPGFYSDKAQSFRSSNGSPAATYWQNRADYSLSARLDTVNNVLVGGEMIDYTNNSPDSLYSLWLQLDQNTYRADARSNQYTEPAPTEFTNGYVLERVAIVTAAGGRVLRSLDADYIVTDTRMQIRLKRALAPRGGHIQIDLHYHYTIPGAFGNRTDFTPTRNGKIFEIAQWYPRMCVYDGLEGWNTLPFLGSGEFYCEYGDIDYTVIVPKDMIVAGAGELQNPEEVLTKKEIGRLAQARVSDQTIIIRDTNDIGTLQPSNITSPPGMLTWHFKMVNTRDVAFGASRAYIWDAARVNLPGGKRSLAMSVYPVESAGDNAWNRATEYLKKSIEYFSAQWYVYPYPVAINEAGIAGGMEYPGIVFDGMNDKGKDLYWITAHEIGHDWFPMVVGSDERRYAFMDEGFNTFIDIYAADAFNKGEYSPKRDSEYAEGGGNPVDEIIPWLKDTLSPVIMTRADEVPEKYRHPIEYFKPALGLVLLREVILGKDRFDYAFRQYIREWAFRHPTPVDFFRTMDNQAGEDLSWFWREWYYHNWTLDLAVKGVSYVDNDPKKGVEITILNLDKMAMPVTVELEWKDGRQQRIQLPVETWLQSGTHVLHLPGGQALAGVTLDPDHVLPDANRKNNVWKNGDIR